MMGKAKAKPKAEPKAVPQVDAEAVDEPEGWKEALQAAYDEGDAYSEWDDEQLVQSAEYANSVLPYLRALAGYADNKYGTYTELPEVPGKSEADVQDELEGSFEELLDAFWEGYGEGSEGSDDDESDDSDEE